MSTLEEEVEEASRGRKLPHNRDDQDSLRKKKSADTNSRFDKVNSNRKDSSLFDLDRGPDYAKGSEKETLSDKITPHIRSEAANE